jgi:hypothetical protein
MAAWWLWVSTDARRRRRPALVLAVLVALAGGVVLAAVAGGRRNGSAAERATALTAPAEAWVAANLPGFDWDAVRRLSEVETVAEFPVTFFEVEEHPDVEPAFPAGSPEAMTELEVPLVVEGRLPRPDRVDEVTISPQAHGRGIEIGDHLTLTMLSAEAMAAVFGGGDPSAAPPGPRQTVEVVGIVKGSFFTGDVQTTFAFYDRYRDTLTPPGIGYVNALVKLRGGVDDLPRLEADLTEQAGHPIELVESAAVLKRTTNATHLERDALYGFAAAAAAATLVLVGQAVVRMVASSLDEVPQLVALGFTRGTTVAALGALPAAAAGAASLGAGVVAYLLSGRFPIGVGRQVEPHPGRHLDWAVVGPGVVLLLVGAVLGVFLVATLVLRRSRSRVVPAGSRLAARAAAADTPVPLALGVRLALERGVGRTAVPVRPALVGAVAGVLGVVAALTFGVGLDRGVDDATLFGQTFDAAIIGVGSDIVPPEARQALVAHPDVEMVAEIRNAIVQVEGQDVSVFGIRTLSGDLRLQPVSGRVPTAPDEIALAPRTRAELDVDIGDRIRLGDGTLLTVTGELFSPELSHTSYDEGGVMTDDALRRFMPTDDAVKFHNYAVRFRPGPDVEAAIGRVNQDVGIGLEPRMPLYDQEAMKGVRTLPLLLGAFLALLAVGAVGHALASTVRRRRHDFAVLRVLGLTRRQARATVAWQATTLALVGLVFGVPFGMALGRTLWQVIAERTPMLYAPPVALAALLLVPPAAIVVCNAVAAWPAHVAARLRPAESLRTE